DHAMSVLHRGSSQSRDQRRRNRGRPRRDRIRRHRVACRGRPDARHAPVPGLSRRPAVPFSHHTRGEQPMLKIYEFKGFPNPTRVRIALAEKELSDKVEFISIDVPGGEHRLPAFAKKNPYATVPVLELEDGTCISECTAITEYVDNLVGEPVLTGKSAKDRAVIHMMQRRAETGLLDAAATYFHH